MNGTGDQNGASFISGAWGDVVIIYIYIYGVEAAK